MDENGRYNQIDLGSAFIIFEAPVPFLAQETDYLDFVRPTAQLAASK
jgi:hypothetical protein